MKKKVWVIGGIATAVVLAGGFALAQSGPHGPSRFRPAVHARRRPVAVWDRE